MFLKLATNNFKFRLTPRLIQNITQTIITFFKIFI